VYSDPITGKSTFAATFPKPMLVFFFDGYLKDSPYLDKGFDGGEGITEDGTPYRDVVDDKGDLLIRVMYLHDENPERPSAYKRFLNLMNSLNPVERQRWETIVVDSMSAMSRANMVMHQFDLNPSYKDPRKWYADVADYIERIITRFSGIRDVNIVMLCHISRKMDEASGGYMRTIKLPGRLGLDGPDTFPEIYRLYVEQGTGRRLLQTQKSSDSWLAGSQFCKAPTPCEPRYSAVWSNWSPRTRPVAEDGKDAVEATAMDAVVGAPMTDGDV
jgi:hypothetical protein